MNAGLSGYGAMAHEVIELIREKEEDGENIHLAGAYEPLEGGNPGDYYEVTPDVIIDFSNPENIERITEYAKNKGTALVIATTGLNMEKREMIRKASENVPVVLSANFSPGVNLMASAVREISHMTGDDFDIEIIEKHHKRKLDSPSGTALLLADAVNTDGRYEFTYGRFGSKRREKAEIGIHAVRCGNITGEHTVIFAGDDEVIEITHKAGSKRIFASGAIKAAYFTLENPPGLYDMNDVLKTR